MKHKRTPAREYPAGFFSELVRAHNFPPMFEPRIAWNPQDAVRVASANASRESALANGRGWKTGTIALPGSLKSGAPGMLVRPV